MTIEKVFNDLFEKYGDDFNWILIPLTQSTGILVEELKKEIGKDHYLYHKKIYAVAKCESNDDVLYVTEKCQGTESYYIFHLTYSKCNVDGFPLYDEYTDACLVGEHLEQLYIENCR